MHVRLGGFFRLVVTAGDGSVREDTGWFKNLITNQGLDWFGVVPAANRNDPTSFAFVGTGNTPPAFTDTTMTAMVNPGALRTSASQSYHSGTPPYYSFVTTYQWAQGAIVANLAEVGVGNEVNLTPPYNGPAILFSHALIVDGSGNPTTLTVTATDTLSVSYECRLYLNTTDTNYSLVIGGTTYSGLYRLANLTTPNFTPYNMPSFYTGSLPVISYYPGVIGPITGVPSGSPIIVNPSTGYWSFGTYTIGSYTIQATVNIPANQLGAINVTAISVLTLIGMWQFSVSPSWNRLATQNISTTWAFSWGRY